MQNKDKSPTLSPTTNNTIPFGLKPRSGNVGKKINHFLYFFTSVLLIDICISIFSYDSMMKILSVF